jgi:hypothetical protein
MATFAATTQLSTGGKLTWNGRFVALPAAVLAHPAFPQLPAGAIKLLLAIAKGYVGNNNGQLVATLSRMKHSGINSKDSLAKGIQNLINFGLIVRTRSQVLRSPALYALTWLPINAAPAGTPYDPGILPSDEAQDQWRHVDASRRLYV